MIKQSSVRFWLKPEALQKETTAKDLAPQKQPLTDVCKKVLLRNFLKLTGKHLYWSLYLIKLQTSSQALY